MRHLMQTRQGWVLVLATAHVHGDREIAATFARLGVARPAPAPRTVSIPLEPAGGWDAAHDRADAEALHHHRALPLRIGGPVEGSRAELADLPPALATALDENLGERLAAWLTGPETEILGIVDWDQRRAFGDEVPLRRVARHHLVHLVPDASPTAAFARANRAAAGPASTVADDIERLFGKAA